MSLFEPIAGPLIQGDALPSYDALLGCIRCGRCLPVCPTYRETRVETFSPRGRLSLLRAHEDGRLALSRVLSEHLYHCLDCRACNVVCPPGVAVGELIVRGRAAAEKAHPRPWWLRWLLTNALASPARAEKAALHLRLIQALHLDRAGALLLARMPGAGRTISALADFAPRLRRPLRLDLPQVAPACGATRHRVAFFLGCLMDIAMPDVSRATVRVLTRAGCEVVTPRFQACCGAPHDDQGLRDVALRMARHNVLLFEPLLHEVDAIVTDCAGCGAALKEYGRWLMDDPAWAERAQRFSARVRDVTEWLAAVWPDDLSLRHTPVRAVYHDPCHLANVQNVRDQPRALLARVEGLDLRSLSNDSPAECCGSAGIYNLTHPRMALSLLERKMDAIARTQAELVVSANPGCLMQLQWGKRRSKRQLTIRHVVEVLDASLEPIEDRR